jgi:putative methionine-R-sulfoxide reductase with GAF domain
VTPLGAVLQRLAARLEPHRAAVVEAWAAASPDSPARGEGAAGRCAQELERTLARLAQGDLEGLVLDERRAAEAAARQGRGPAAQALELRAWEGACLRTLAGGEQAPPPSEETAALQEVARRRLGALLEAHEVEAARRLAEAEDQAAQAADRARDLAAANESLRQAQALSQHRAEQIALISAFARRISRVREPERLMQDAAEIIQARMNHTYVAVVVLDDEGMLVGRWAGRAGVGRRSAGRAQGPAAGVIGRALRKRAPQVVDDVAEDADYHADVPGTRSEMVIPLLEEGEVVGAVDFQSERVGAFDLDAVATGETAAEFLVIALRNARLLAEARRS